MRSIYLPMKHLVFLLLTLLAHPSLGQDIIEEIPFRADVDQGSLRVEVPIQQPKSAIELIPEIGLSYHSDNNAGSLVGIGWSLNGLSSVSLCIPPYYDGKFTYTYREDAYCWDGKLIKESDGNFKTEIEDYSKIEIVELSRKEIDKFIIRTRDKKKITLGGSDQTKVFFNNSKQVYQWLLNKIEDKFGNNISLEYKVTDGFPYLSRINYVNTKVEFEYKSIANGPMTYYRGKFLYQTKYSLVSVSTYVGSRSRLHSKYLFTYEPYLNERILKSIKYCGSEPSACLNPLEFKYDNLNSEPVYSTLKNLNPYCSKFSTNRNQRWMIDMNGDGRLDIATIQPANNSLMVSLNSGEHFGQLREWKKNNFGTLDYTQRVVQVLDLNMDGRADYLIISSDGIHVALGSKSTDSLNDFTKWSNEFGISTWPSTKIYFLQDVNGDRLPDFVAVLNNGVYVALNNLNSFGPSKKWSNTPYDSYASFLNRFLVDMNQDGLLDLVTMRNGGWNIEIEYNSGSEFVNSNKIAFGTPNVLRVDDINNDGLPDFIRLYPYGYNLNIFVMLNNGNNTFSKEIIYGSVKFDRDTSPNVVFSDINNDGFLDVVWLDLYSKSIFGYLNNRTGIEPTRTNITFLNSDVKVDQSSLEISYLFPNESLSFLVISDCNIFATYSLNKRLLMSSIKSSFETVTRIEYGDLPDQLIHKYSDAAVQYPYYNLNVKTVVRSLITPTGLVLKPFNTTFFKYQNLVANLLRPGFYSFESIMQSFSTSNLEINHQFYTEYPLTSRRRMLKKSLNNVIIYDSKAEYIISEIAGYSRVLAVNPRGTFETYFELDGSFIKSISSSFSTTDKYGNTGSIVENITSTSSSFIRKTYHEYARPDDENWFINSMRSSNILYEQDTRRVDPRRVEYEYDQDNHALINQMFQPSDSKYARYQRFEYDTYGNVIKKTEGPAGSQVDSNSNEARVQTFEYQNGAYLSKHCNSMNHCETYTYDDIGNRISEIGPNNIETKYQYDAFGRVVSEISSNLNISKKYTKYLPDLTTPKNAYYQELTYLNEKLNSYKFFDNLNRVVRAAKLAYDGSFSIIDYEYDWAGNLVKESLPRFENSKSVSYITYSYDALGRRISMISPLNWMSNLKTEFIYNGNEIITSVNGKEKKVEINAAGKIASVTDQEGSKTSYYYDLFDNLEKIVDPLGHETKFTYNSFGFKIELDDPSLGVTVFDYNVFGEVTYQKDAKGQETFFKRDKLGRVIERKESEGITQWVYDTAQNGVGKLATVQMKDYVRNHEYDSNGREFRISYAIDNENYQIERKYDNFNRIISETYPNSFSYYWCYNNFHYLVGISKSSKSCKKYLWKAEQYDARENILEESFNNEFNTVYNYDLGNRMVSEQTRLNDEIIRKNSYVFDRFSNLIDRETLFANGFFRHDRFTYDKLDRLTSVDFSSGDQRYNYHLTYDKVGNIASNSRISEKSFKFDLENPFALIQAGSNKYKYDKNGNMVLRNGKKIVWTSYNQPIEFETPEGGKLSYQYGPDREKIKRVDSNGDETIYIGQFYERVRRKRISVKDVVHKYAVVLNGKLLLQTMRNSDGSDEETLYFNSDYTGSQDTVSLGDGTVLLHYNYSAFGEQNKMVNEKSKENYLCLLNRGFTGHEHMDGLGLIHMNGRVYDPLIGRFLSPDPFVSDIYDLQALNRYSYVLNNPFKYRDPSGHFFGFIFSIFSNFLFAAVMNASVSVITTFASSVLLMSKTMSTIVAHAIVGGVSTLIKGGSVREVISGVFFGTAMGMIGVHFGDQFTVIRVLAESTVGGVANVFRGKSFLKGFGITGLFSTANFLYNYLLKGPADGRPGTEVDMKKGDKGRPTFDKKSERWPNQVGIADQASKSSFVEGGKISNILNAIPGINAVAVVHDNMQIRWDNWFKGARTAMNLPSMVPAFMFAGAALASGPQSYSFMMSLDRQAETLQAKTFCPNRGTNKPPLTQTTEAPPLSAAVNKLKQANTSIIVQLSCLFASIMHVLNKIAFPVISF